MMIDVIITLMLVEVSFWYFDRKGWFDDSVEAVV